MEVEMETDPSMRDPRVAVIVLLNSIKYLDTPDLMSASQVSWLWYSIVSRKVYWRTIRLDSCSAKNMKNLARIAKIRRSTALDMMGAYRTERTSRDYWNELLKQMEKVDSLTELRLGRCEPDVLTLFGQVSLGKTVSSLTIDLMYGYCYLSPEIIDSSLCSLSNLKVLCLSISGSGCTADIGKLLIAVAGHRSLTDLQLCNFIVTEEFPSYLRRCSRLKKLSMVPDLRGISYQVVIDGVKSLKNTLDSFRLGIHQALLVSSTRDLAILSSRGCKVTRMDKEDTGVLVPIRVNCDCEAVMSCNEPHIQLYGLNTLRITLCRVLSEMETELFLL